MKIRKIKIAIIFGGKSAEHEVSIQSAKNVFEALDKNKYEPVLIRIDRDGRWYLGSKFLLEGDKSNLNRDRLNKEVAPIQAKDSNNLIDLTTHETVERIDVAFPVLHGPYGEDGTIQGLFEVAGIPYIGAGVTGSSIGMDKDVMKRLLRDAGMPIAKFITFTDSSVAVMPFNEITEKIGLPMFVKPANLGSSVGINKANNRQEFEKAIEVAFKYDKKILIEEFIQGREIECSVLGNESPIASLPGEIILNSEFYSYEAKYIDENGAILEIPAKLPESIIKKIQDYAVKVFKILCCQGMARVDFFLKDNMEVIINEINTIPGFTNISMFPRLWEVSGISYSELIDRLIELAVDKFEKRQKLQVEKNN